MKLESGMAPRISLRDIRATRAQGPCRGGGGSATQRFAMYWPTVRGCDAIPGRYSVSREAGEAFVSIT
jgi:hypothetical protein